MCWKYVGGEVECVYEQLKIVAFLSISGGMNALASLLQMIWNVCNVQTTGVVFPGLLKEIVSFHDCLHKPFVSHGGLILFGNLACGIHYFMILRKTLFQPLQQISTSLSSRTLCWFILSISSLAWSTSLWLCLQMTLPGLDWCILDSVFTSKWMPMWPKFPKGGTIWHCIYFKTKSISEFFSILKLMCTNFTKYTL